jgi:phosphate-selective porin
MRNRSSVLTISVLTLACLAFAMPAAARSRTVIASSVTSVGNSVTIKSSGGVTVVESSNNCSAGVSGYLFQSVVFSGGWFVSSQSTTCP